MCLISCRCYPSGIVEIYDSQGNSNSYFNYSVDEALELFKTQHNHTEYIVTDIKHL